MAGSSGSEMRCSSMNQPLEQVLGNYISEGGDAKGRIRSNTNAFANFLQLKLI